MPKAAPRHETRTPGRQIGKYCRPIARPGNGAAEASDWAKENLVSWE
jgi:hypothetical protein